MISTVAMMLKIDLHAGPHDAEHEDMPVHRHEGRARAPRSVRPTTPRITSDATDRCAEFAVQASAIETPALGDTMATPAARRARSAAAARRRRGSVSR
jgi:hypothetical protein